MRVARFLVALSLTSSVVIGAAIERAEAQVTTATVRGVVKGADDGVPMAEVEVTLVDESTGSVKTTTTNADGIFAFNNVQIGGPYNVTASVPGFKSAEEKGFFLSANKTQNLTLGLRLQEEVIEVVGTAVARNTSNKTIVGAAEIDSLPSVGRDPRDVVRRNPEVSVEGRDKTLSIGGNNTRFNSITVDGIRQDDDFGLNQSGYPTRRSPIALSAIQELTVDSSPFDVHYGKFLGGNVNVVTKSGTNEFKGVLVGTFSNDSLLGNKSRTDTVNVDFSEYRYGLTLGGPIVKDKAHFLVSIEGLNATTPVDVGPNGSGASTTVGLVSAGDLAKVQDISQRVYGFNAGVPAQSLKEGDLKLLAKVDWSIDKKNRVDLIYQRTGGNSIQASGASNVNLPLTSNWYDARDTLNTFSGHWFSDWTDQISTVVELNGKLVTSRVPPLNGNGFMQATIKSCGASNPTGVPDFTCGTGVANGNLILGPDVFRHANELDNDVLHGKGELNYLAGNHLITGGLEYEQLRIRNLFVPRSNGQVTYNSIADFEMEKPAIITYNNSITLNPSDAQAKWNSGTITMYLQDQVKLTPDLTVQGGVRAEIYESNDEVVANQNFFDRYGFANTSTLTGRSIVMPRLGISWLPTTHLNLRAGAGLYSGGTPSVWMSNNYSNDGVRINSVTLNAFNANGSPNLANQAIMYGFDGFHIPDALKALVKAGNGNVDVLDPNFKIPSAWKVGVGGDYSFDLPALGANGKNFELKANYTFSKTAQGVTWEDLRRDLAVLPNNIAVGTTPDGRPLYDANYNVNRGFDMMLTNTRSGHGQVASVQLQKGFPFGLFVFGSYAYQSVLEVNPGTSSISTSNYNNTAVVDPNHPDDAVSNYQRAHRFTAAVEYSQALIKNLKTSLGLFVESRSGQPYSWVFSDTANGANIARIFGMDNTTGSPRQLFYVPLDSEVCNDMGTTATPGCKVNLGDPNSQTGIKKDEFDAFLKRTGLDQYRGKIAPRNAFNSPWFSRFDMRLSQDLPNPISGNRARFVVDIENVGNLLNANWGRAQAAPFPYAAPAVDLTYDRANNRYVYQNLKSADPTRVDILSSVWRVSLGLMYDF
jgi:hypothetical protein